MPQPGKRPHHRQVQHPAGTRHAVAPQRDVYIVTKPCSQADMPAPPELGNAAGNIGILKVFGKMKAENTPQANGHIAVAGKIKVQMQHIGQRIQPAKQHRALLGRLELRYQCVQCVGQQHLFAEACHKAGKPGGQILPGGAARVQLLAHIGIAHDGACDQLRKHGDIGGQIHQVFLRRHRAAPHIHHIADDLKGVKADADGQRHPDYRDIPAGELPQILRKKARILAPAQQPQTDAQRCRKRQIFALGVVFPALGQQAKAIALRNGKQHEPHKFRLAPCIKHKACRQQHAIAKTPGAHKVYPQHHRQKII